MYMIIILLTMLASWYANYKLKQKFKQYSRLGLQSNLSGKEVAEMMLADHGIRDVQVISTEGHLTDHYNPDKKTINLSDVVYNSRNVAATAVASHECGHAVQHAQAYSWLQMRSKMVPAVMVASQYNTWLIFGGLILMSMQVFIGYYVAVLGVVLFGVATLFSFVTLPVEYDASNRALAWIKARNIVTPTEYDGAKDALKWAARTYVVSALGSLAQLLYWVMILLGRSE